MNTSEIIFSIAGIFFGGGMVGKIIMFLIKRNDEKKEKSLALYQELYDKLCTYKTRLENVLLENLKDSSNSHDEIDHMKDNVNRYILEIKSAQKKIANFEKRCRKKGRPEQGCDECRSLRQRIPQLFQLSEQELQHSESLLQQQLCYWKTHKDSVFQIISDNVNIHNILYRIGQKDKKIRQSLSVVNNTSFSLLKQLLDTETNGQEIQKTMLKQLVNIENSIDSLSQKWR